MPLILDAFIEIVIRVAINGYRRVASRSWLGVTARITGACVEHRGGPELVIVTYRYKIEGEPFTGRHTEPFLSTWNREEYVQLFPADGQCRLQVNPADPSKSVLVSF